MKKSWLILLLALIFCLPASVFAETITLKSGKTVKGTIVEKTDQYVKIDVAGIPIKYYSSFIQSISSDESTEPLTPAAGETENKTPEPVSKPDTNKGSSFKTAVITYQVSSALGNGDETIYIDGDKIACESSIMQSFGGFTNLKKEKSIFDGKTFYQIDDEERKALRVDFPSTIKKENVRNVLGVLPDERSFAGYYEKNEMLMGKDCKVYDTGAQKMYFFKGLPLKQETVDIVFGRKNELKEATDVQLDVPVSEARFRVPDDYRIYTGREVYQELGDALKKLQKAAKEKGKSCPFSR